MTSLLRPPPLTPGDLVIGHHTDQWVPQNSSVFQALVVWPGASHALSGLSSVK